MAIDLMSEYFWTALEHCFKTSKFVNQGDLAIAAGVNQATISEFLGRKKAGRPPTQAKIAGAFGYQLLDFLILGRDLLSGKPAEPSKPKPTPEPSILVTVNGKKDKEFLEERTANYRGIPLYESGKLAAGPGGLSFDIYEPPVSTVLVYQPELKGRLKHNLKALRVGGDSMWPIAPKGSIVVVDLNDKEFVDRKIYVVQDIDTDPPIGAVKRVRKGKQGFVLISENREYLPEVTDLDWHQLCVGRVIWVWKNLDEV